jgi:fatty acid-binding protein DegV
LLQQLAAQTHVVAVAHDLSFGVRGGRVPRWLKRVTDLLHVNPVLMASPKGRLTLGGLHRGRGANADSLARSVVRRMKKAQMYRVLIAHANDAEGAGQLRRLILRQHGEIHSCHITEAGPAIGVHLGPGGLIVGFMPQPDVLR